MNQVGFGGYTAVAELAGKYVGTKISIQNDSRASVLKILGKGQEAAISTTEFSSPGIEVLCQPSQHKNYRMSLSEHLLADIISKAGVPIKKIEVNADDYSRIEVNAIKKSGMVIINSLNNARAIITDSFSSIVKAFKDSRVFANETDGLVIQEIDGSVLNHSKANVNVQRFINSAMQLDNGQRTEPFNATNIHIIGKKSNP